MLALARCVVRVRGARLCLCSHTPASFLVNTLPSLPSFVPRTLLLFARSCKQKSVGKKGTDEGMEGMEYAAHGGMEYAAHDHELMVRSLRHAMQLTMQLTQCILLAARAMQLTQCILLAARAYGKQRASC